MFDTPGPSAGEGGSATFSATPSAASLRGDGYSITLRHTEDAEEHAACLSNWQQRYDQLSAGPFRGAFEEFCFGAVQVFREDLNQTVHQIGQPWRGSRTFAVPLTVEGTGWFAGERYDWDSVVTVSGDDELDFRTPRRLEMLACGADAQALSDYARQVDHRDLEAELAGRKLLPVPVQQAETLRTVLNTVLASLRATPDLLRHLPMRRALEQGLFAALLDALHRVADTPLPAPSGRTRQFVVARARDYMQAHIEEPITVADLCVALGVSRRTLQYSFQDVLDLNPVKFLRALRLNGVRRALRRADPDSATVGDIAARWGFWHLSHFSADYKEMFGELPSETLRRPA